MKDFLWNAFLHTPIIVVSALIGFLIISDTVQALKKLSLTDILLVIFIIWFFVSLVLLFIYNEGVA